MLRRNGAGQETMEGGRKSRVEMICGTGRFIHRITKWSTLNSWASCSFTDVSDQMLNVELTVFKLHIKCVLL